MNNIHRNADLKFGEAYTKSYIVYLSARSDRYFTSFVEP